METAVLVEPSPTGFRASTQSPVPLSADGTTESAAMAALTAVLRQQLPNGGKIRMMTVDAPQTVLDICAEMRANPLHEEFEKAIQGYRKIANAVPDAG